MFEGTLILNGIQDSDSIPVIVMVLMVRAEQLSMEATKKSIRIENCRNIRIDNLT